MAEIPRLAELGDVPGVREAVQTFVDQVQELRRSATPPRLGEGLGSPLPHVPPGSVDPLSVIGGREEVHVVGAQLNATETLLRLIANIPGTLGPQAVVAGLDEVRKTHPEVALPDFFGPATVMLGGLVKAFVRIVLGETRASQIAVEGGLFQLFGSIHDAIIQEDVLTSGPLSFAQVLQYENQLSGMHTVLILASFVFHLVVEAVSLGTLGSSIGLLLHVLDSTVGDASRVVSTQLVRRAVSDPLVGGYDRIHRHKGLSASEAEESYALGLLPEVDLVETLAASSFTDEAIQRKVELGRIRALNQAGTFPLRTKAIPPTTLIQAYAAKIVDDVEFLGELSRQGYDDNALEIFHALAQLRKPPPAPPGVA